MQIDELIVSLVLDPTGFKKGQRDAADATGKLKQVVTADAKATEAAVAKVTTGVEALGRKFLGLYALVTAGRGLREFVSDLTSADSALGRTAKNIDLSSKALSTWQLAAEASGGSAAGITGTMRNLSGELQRAALTGTSSVIPAFKALGINLADTKGHARDVRDILTDMNRRAQGMDPAKFTALANLAGIADEGSISMLEMKTSEFDKLIAAQEKYAATQADVDAAQKRQSGWRELLITSTSIGRTILTAVTPALVAMMKAVQEWANGKDWTKLSKPISDFLQTLTNADWKGFIGQAEGFATKLAAIATAADDAAKGLDGNSVLFKGLGALGTLAGVQVLGSVVSLTAGLGKLAGIPVTGLLARILMNPVLAGTLGLGFLLASGDPDKSVLAGGHPDVQPQDNDLGLPGVGGDRPNDTSRPAGVWSWIKANAAPDFGKAYAEMKAMGFGDRLPKGPDDAPPVPTPPEQPQAQHGGLWDSLKRLVGFGDDPKVKDNVEATAKSTAGIFDLMRTGATADAGVAGRAGGGVMGAVGRTLRNAAAAAGAGFGSSTSRPAKGALAANQKVAYEAALKEGLSPKAARAQVANMSGEGLAVPNDYHWDGKHYSGGIVQWDPARSAAIKAKFGDVPWKLSVADQTRASIWEWRTNPRFAATKRAMEGDDAGEMIQALVNNYEDPANKGRAIAQRMGYYRGFNPSAALSTPSPSGFAPVSDGDVSAARARITSGHPLPGDQALIGRYLKEQNTPPSVSHGPSLAGHHALRAALMAIGHANRLTHHNAAVPVTMDERGARHINEDLRRRVFGARRAGYNHAIERAMDHASSIAHMHRAAGLARHIEALNHTVHNVDNSSATTIANMTVHTRAENGRELAADLDKHLARSREAQQFNSGLA